MGLGMIMDFQLELLAFAQLLAQGKHKKEDVIYDRRISCRRKDRRKYSYKRTSLSSDVHYDKLNEQGQDRRNTFKERRKRDRRALERIKKI